MYWTYNLVVNHLSTFVAAKLYFTYRDASQENNENLTERSVWYTLGVLEVMAILSFAGFFCSMNKSHDKSSFYAAITGPQYCCKLFLESKSDKERIDIFDHHPSYYEDVRPVAAEWVRERWEHWKAELPEFLRREKSILAVPDDVICKEEKEEMLRLIRHGAEE